MSALHPIADIRWCGLDVWKVPLSAAATADDLRFVATHVTGMVIPNSGHWLMEEQPAKIEAVPAFIDAGQWIWKNGETLWLPRRNAPLGSSCAG